MASWSRNMVWQWRRRCHSFLFVLFLCFALAETLHVSGEYQASRPDGAIRGARWTPRRMLIGSMAPMCTYECRSCKYRCRAEQVPVDGNDPIHSAYHYRCVCHREVS